MVLPVLLLLLLCACDWSMEAQKQEVTRGREMMFRELWTQHLREALAKKNAGPRWSSGSSQMKLLCCNVGDGLHLQILSSGVVQGVHCPNESCWLRVLALRAGVVAIRGEKSQRYLCIRATGRVYAQESFSAECELRENMEENHYNTYSSHRYPGLYLGLSRHGDAKNATKVEPWRSAAHFLPLTEMRFCPPMG